MAQLENFRLKVFRAVAEHLNFHKAKVCRAVDRPHAQSCDIKSAMKNDPARHRGSLIHPGCPTYAPRYGHKADK